MWLLLVVVVLAGSCSVGESVTISAAVVALALMAYDRAPPSAPRSPFRPPSLCAAATGFDERNNDTLVIVPGSIEGAFFVFLLIVLFAGRAAFKPADSRSTRGLETSSSARPLPAGCVGICMVRRLCSRPEPANTPTHTFIAHAGRRLRPACSSSCSQLALRLRSQPRPPSPWAVTSMAAAFAVLNRARDPRTRLTPITLELTRATSTCALSGAGPRRPSKRPAASRPSACGMGKASAWRRLLYQAAYEM